MSILNQNRLFANGLFITIISLSLISCKGNTDKNDPKSIAEDHNEAKFNDSKKKDADFMVDMVELNLRQIELAKIAQTQGATKDVKEMGKKMEATHTKFLNELKELAKSKSITIPDSIAKNRENDKMPLTDKTGDDFDKSFCGETVDEHKEAIKKCEKAATDADDIEIKNWATKALPTLREVLDQAMICERSNKTISKN